MLEKECRENGVQLFPKTAIHKVTRSDEFVAKAAEHEFRAPALVVATGGLSIPKMGATGFGYDLARQFGLKIRETRPGLVPLLFGAEDGRHYSDLAGVSADVIAACNGQRFREKMLFTHRGLSGPAILQISTYWKKSGSISIDLAPELGRHRGATRVCSSAKYRDRCGQHCADFSPTVLPTGGWNSMPPKPGGTPPSSNWSAPYTVGPCSRRGPRATEKPR